MKYFLGFLFAGLLNIASAPAFAFGPDGHKEVGAIADSLLKNSAAAKQVQRILGGQSLQKVAIWADCAKSVGEHDGRFTYDRKPTDHTECAVFDAADDNSRFADFVARNWAQCGTSHGSQHCHDQYHYADVSNVHFDYQYGYVGTNDHDIVHAINAAVAYLRHRNTGGPFSFADEKEALMLLTHYLGDLHQPMHVVAIYLDQQGNVVNPEGGAYSTTNDTDGGNKLNDLSAGTPTAMHTEWDRMPAGVSGGKLLEPARKVVDTIGDPDTWAQRWATESVTLSPVVFGGLTFTLQNTSGAPNTSAKWDVTGIDAAYATRADGLKAQQIAKAGARLAQVLKAIWPDRPPKEVICGYLSKGNVPESKPLLPPAPQKDDMVDVPDMAAITSTRALLKTPRGKMAAEDDVFDPAAIVARFNDALGVRLSMENAPTLMVLIKRMQKDGSVMVGPIKQNIAQGGRVRPFVRATQIPTCLSPVDLANNKDQDLLTYGLGESGSYPSTHALVGMAVGMVLSQVAPDRSDAVLARGYEFGESRVVCGFHYPSDVTAGRLAAVALLEHLNSESAFVQDLRHAASEVAAARAGH
jgi:hypothetical protein